MTFETALEGVLDELGVVVSATQFALLCRHFRLLEHWNRRINLTSVCDPLGAARRHFGESAFVHRELPATQSLVDVGSGAGFPGIPMAVLRPETSVTLLEATRKKSAFLHEASRDLPNVSVEARRLAHWAGQADWALLRGVAPASVLPDLATRVSGVAVLSGDSPHAGSFGPWEARPVPWGESRRLWISKR